MFFFVGLDFRNIAFVAGSFFAVLTCLSVYDQDVFRAEHMLTAIATLGKPGTTLIKVIYIYNICYFYQNIRYTLL